MSNNKTLLDYPSLVSSLTDVVTDDSFSLEERAIWASTFLAEQLGFDGPYADFYRLYDVLRERTLEYSRNRLVGATEYMNTIKNLRECSMAFANRGDALSYIVNKHCSVLSSRFSECAIILANNTRQQFLSVKTAQEPIRRASLEVNELNALKTGKKVRHPSRVSLLKGDGSSRKTRLTSSQKKNLIDACDFIDDDELF